MTTPTTRELVADRREQYAFHDDIVYLRETGSPALLAASNRRTAARLLWSAIASAPAGEPVEIGHVTPANEWAVDVGLTARLSVTTRGYLALRGMKPPTPYLPHSSLL